jgi:hypothetical protein
VVGAGYKAFGYDAQSFRGLKKPIEEISGEKEDESPSKPLR